MITCIDPFAGQLGLNVPLFKIDLLDEYPSKRSMRITTEALTGGVKTAPAIFINGERHPVPPNYLLLMEAIEENTSLVF